MIKSLLPRPEYPRPQFVREPWINLNGTWTYTFDFGKSGWERGFAESTGFDQLHYGAFLPGKRAIWREVH